MSKGPVAGGSLPLGQREQETAGSEMTQEVGRARPYGLYGIKLLHMPYSPYGCMAFLKAKQEAFKRTSRMRVAIRISFHQGSLPVA